MEKLRYLRKKQNYSMKKLGEIIGVSESTISLYENGHRQPDFNTLIKLADYFNVTVDYLIGRENEKTILQSTTHTPALTQFENELLTIFRKMDIHAQNKLIGYAYALIH